MAEYLKRLREQRGDSPTGSTDKKKRGTGYTYAYKPNKNARKIRSHIWDRYERMRDDPLRKEAEVDWEQADKKMRMWRPERDPEDWRADIRLPDAFAAVQTHMQETIGMKIRPGLKPQEGSDTALAYYGNGLMNFNMDRTDFDLEVIRAINCSASRGTAFTVEEQLFERRWVMDPISVSMGVLKYKKTERIDKDDTYTQFVANEHIYVDEAADRIENAEDYIREEILRFDTFKSRYGNDDRYFDVDKVVPCGSMRERTNYFDNADNRMEGDQVQVLKYYNREKDAFQILANSVVIGDDPLPWAHKELNLAVWNYYPVEGRIYGLGIPKIISPLQEEREAIRSLSIDRQKMHLNKMFLVSDLFDIDEDEATTRPHGFIHVSSGGMPLSNTIQPLEYGDVPGSSIRMDDQLRDDEKRVTGIDDRSQGINMGGTATEAAILTENSQKRINLINTLTGMATIKRIGYLKWANIRFFWPAPRIERIMQDNKEVDKKTYRKISVEGKEFNVVTNPQTGKTELAMNDITGTGTFSLDSTYAGFMDKIGDADIRIQWDIKAQLPQAIRQSKVMEVFQAFMGSPFAMKEMNVRRALKDVLMEFDIDPKTWMSDGGKDEDAQMAKAGFENQLMLKGLALDPTEGASEMHTMVHLWFIETQPYLDAVKENPAIADIFNRHILGENENGPGGNAAGQGTPPPAAGMNGIEGTEGMNAPGPVEGMPGAPNQAMPQGNSAAPASAPPATPIVNGGAVTNEMAPVR